MISIYRPDGSPVCSCDADEGKQSLLTQALSSFPSDEDTFDIAVAIRENLPAGLAANDFDGWTIDAIRGLSADSPEF